MIFVSIAPTDCVSTALRLPIPIKLGVLLNLNYFTIGTVGQCLPSRVPSSLLCGTNSTDTKRFAMEVPTLNE
jgi:hypothetical protein